MTLEKTITAPNGTSWKQPLGLFINNEFVRSSNGQTLATVNPYTEKEIAQVYTATDQDVDTAVNAARAAFESGPWHKMDGTARGLLMFKLADLMAENLTVLATIETLDNGKPFTASTKVDVPAAIGAIRYYAGWADKIHGRTIDLGDEQKLGYTLRQPVGVCGQIVPWNYPLITTAWKLGPALACGNTIVLKLAENTPLSGLYLAQLITQAGFPPGVINIINGLGREAGADLCKHPDVDKIAFTGSTAVGKEIMKMAAGTIKKVTLEVGAKGPVCIFADADLDAAASWAHWSIMRNAGQTCTGSSRLLVEASVYDAFVAKFRDVTAKASVVGDPFDSKTYQGPQVSDVQRERVLGYVESAKKDGATIAFGGERPANQPSGFFVAPTLFTNVKPHMTIYREEIFGPCTLAVAFKDEAEAVRLANDTTYGLGASLFTRDVSRAHRVARRLNAGSVWINQTDMCDTRLPFGGFKQSGLGHELGEEGLAGYYETKAVHVFLKGGGF